MEDMIVFAIGLVVGLLVVSQAFASPTRERPILIMPVEVSEPSSSGLGCLALIAVGVIILLVMSSS